MCLLSIPFLLQVCLFLLILLSLDLFVSQPNFVSTSVPVSAIIFIAVFIYMFEAKLGLIPLFMPIVKWTLMFPHFRHPSILCLNLPVQRFHTYIGLHLFNILYLNLHSINCRCLQSYLYGHPCHLVIAFLSFLFMFCYYYLCLSVLMSLQRLKTIFITLRFFTLIRPDS